MIFFCKAQRRLLKKKYASLKSSHKDSHRNHANRIFYKKIFRSIDLFVLRDACHEPLCVFGDFYASGTQDAEATKSLPFLCTYFIQISTWSWMSPTYFISVYFDPLFLLFGLMDVCLHRGVDEIGLDFQLPTCPRLFNIFHPFDPVVSQFKGHVCFRRIQHVWISSSEKNVDLHMRRTKLRN